MDLLTLYLYFTYCSSLSDWRPRDSIGSRRQSRLRTSGPKNCCAAALRKQQVYQLVPRAFGAVLFDYTQQPSSSYVAHPLMIFGADAGAEKGSKSNERRLTNSYPTVPACPANQCVPPGYLDNGRFLLVFQSLFFRTYLARCLCPQCFFYRLC